jgi:RNA polymerase sigma-70 factor, ECF subfamily
VRLQLNTASLSGHFQVDMPPAPTMTLDASPVGLTSPSEDADVVDRLRAGHLDAVGELYDQHHEAVRRFARRLLGDASEAEDLVQEVFVRLPLVAKNYRGASSFRSFLVGVTAQLSRHHVRSAARRRNLHERTETEAPLQGAIEAPDRRHERRELANILLRALDTLSFDQRLVFLLSEVEHHTSTEIAAMVRAPEGTVRTRLMHAKKNLRAYLAREGLP